MKKRLVILRVVCVCACLTTGCEKKPNQSVSLTSAAASQMSKQTITNEAQLRRLLPMGIGTNEIVAILGLPRWILEPENGVPETWDYGLPPFPEEGHETNTYAGYIFGATLGLTNGRLAYLGFISGGLPNTRQTRMEEIPPADGPADASAYLKFFLVSETAVAGGRFIDTPNLPKLGYISSAPLLTITNLKELNLTELVLPNAAGGERTNWNFGISLNDEDGRRFKDITTANVSSRLLVMIGDAPVVAPRIMAPIAGGRLALELEDRSLVESLKAKLARLQ